MPLLVLACASGLLQALGYLVYIRKSLSKEIEPNPTTWLMFAYGTALLTVLEWDRDAQWPLLVLPAVCALLSIRVTFLCWRNGKLKWPESWVDRFAFLTDLLLTVAYVSVWYASSHQVISEQEREALVIAFLLCSNASTVISFIPLMREARKNPEHEHPLPWTIWSSAYGTLAVATILEEGWQTELLIYPATNMLLHGFVAILALTPKKKHSIARSRPSG